MKSITFILISLIAIFSCQLPITNAAKILAVFPHVGKSHFFMFQPFVHKLGERGHQVTVITHFTEQKPPKNVNYISLEGSVDKVFFNSFSLELVESMSTFPVLSSMIGLSIMGYDACNASLTHPPVRELIKTKPHFDLVIVEFFNTDCLSILAHILDAPLVGIFSSAMMPWHNDRFGNPDNPSYIVNHFLQYPSEMDFLRRVRNTITTFGAKIFYYLFIDWPADVTIRKHLGEGLPSVRDVVRNASLFLINSHFSLFQPRPLVPNIIELGGFHVQPAKKKLPADLENFLNNSPNGVVFFSLGSTVKSSTMAEEKRKIFAKVFGKLKMNVIWKWEEDTMPDKPDNVLLGKWFPQNELLAHPKVKVFMTHSGLMGTEEAVYHGVPMLMMPLFGDQPLNAASCEEKGLGIIIDYFSLTEETLLNALKKLIEDKSYAENAKAVAEIFKDRPISTMDSALYWTEYVIKYKGARHLRSAAVRLPWYSEYLIDVFLFLTLILALIVYVIKKILSRILSLFKKKEEDEKKKKS